MARTEKHSHVIREWITKEGNQARIVHHTNAGHSCGYIGVPRNHPLYGVDYTSLDSEVAVHGGLTFSREMGKFLQPVRDLWWFGFDCAHAWDKPSPAFISRLSPTLMEFYNRDGCVFRDTNYLIEETNILSIEIDRIAPKPGRVRNPIYLEALFRKHIVNKSEDYLIQLKMHLLVYLELPRHSGICYYLTKVASNKFWSFLYEMDFQEETPFNDLELNRYSAEVDFRDNVHRVKFINNAVRIIEEHLSNTTNG